jgi:hypothetical protein
VKLDRVTSPVTCFTAKCRCRQDHSGTVSQGIDKVGSATTCADLQPAEVIGFPTLAKRQILIAGQNFGWQFT